MVERMIGTVHRHLGKLMEGVPLRDFVHKLPVVETLVRNTPTAPAGLSPAEIILGMKPRTPWDAPWDHYGEMVFVTDPVQWWQNTRRAFCGEMHHERSERMGRLADSHGEYMSREGSVRATMYAGSSRLILTPSPTCQRSGD